MLDYKLKIDTVKSTNVAVNHIFAVDVSGSMSGSLSKMRQHIKNKLSLLVKPDDTVSIIYFSSKGEYGVVFEGQKISSLSDLSDIHNSIDRFLKPLALTGFVEPLKEAMDVVKRIGKNGNNNSFIFMTDGYDNQWGKDKIIEHAKHLPEYFDSISFLEYGWYCNRPLIAQMAQVSGGAHIFSEDYKDYEPVVERLFQNKTVKRKAVKIDQDFAFYLDNNEVILVEANNFTVQVPEDISLLYVMQEGPNYKETIASMDEVDKYIALYVTIHKMKTDMTWELLKSLGDVRLIKLFANCFSKQEYTVMKETVKACIFDESERFIEGEDHNLVPNEDAYTVLDALQCLMSGDNYLLSNHEQFNYSRIGAATTQKNVYEEEVNQIKEKLQNTNNIDEIKALSQQLLNLDTWNPMFKESVSEKGEPILNLVSNESRPNISIQITKKGFVEIPKDKSEQYNLPEKIPTFVYRNYTIIKDGILNMKVLPVSLDEQTFNVLKENKLFDNTQNYNPTDTYLVDLTKLPLINRNMVKKVSAKEFFTQHLQLQILKAKQKVFKYYLDEVAPKQQVKMEQTYGSQAAQWLESIGIKDSGFAPKVKTEKSGDFYYSKELNVKIAGLSSLPSVKAVNEKIAKSSKLNLADKLMKQAIDEYNSFVNSPMVLNSSVKDELIKTWLEAETKVVIKKVKELQYLLNKGLYSILVGQVWFDEFNSLDENELTLVYNAEDVKVQALLEEKEIAI